MDFSTVPTLDLRRFDTDRGAFVRDLGEAYRQFGFCCFSHHGISERSIAAAYNDFKAFFGLPLETKMLYRQPNRPGLRGYTPNKVETAKTSSIADLKEFWHVGRELPGRRGRTSNPYPDILLPNIWPAEIPSFKSSVLNLYRDMEAAACRLLDALAMSVGLPQGYFAANAHWGNSILRGLHYPPVATDDLPAVRAQAHEDISLITLLIGATDSGLEIMTRAGTWLPIPANENTLVANIGDMLARLTNDVFPSTTHRVVNPSGLAATRSRYSMPFFMDPNPDFLIDVLPSCVTPDNPCRYASPITANDYLMERLAEIKLTQK